MIRKFRENDLPSIMQIWFDSNVEAHSFIPAKYWRDNFEMVKDMLPKAEIYIYESLGKISGFIGLNKDYIEGIFVEKNMRSKGIGKQLLNYVKKLKEEMHLSAYKKNYKAISFYQREDFVIQSESIDNDTNEKELLMVWNKRLVKYKRKGNL